MTWTDEQQQHLKEAYGAAFASDPGGVAAGVIAVADLAVSLFLARASGQVKDDVGLISLYLLKMQGEVPPTGDAEDAIARLQALAHEAESLRAKVAEMESQVVAEREYRYERVREVQVPLRAEVERLKKENAECHRGIEEMRGYLSEANKRKQSAESRLSAVREIVMKVRNVPRGAHETADPYDRGFGDGWARRGAVLRSEIDALEGDTPNHSMPSNGSDTMSTAQQHDGLQRLTGAVPVCICRLGMGLPCFAARHPCSPTCTHDDAATPGHHERVEERSETVNDTLEHIAWSDERRHGYEDGWDKGAEAMRAACWEQVVTLLVKHGLQNLREEFKRAIEGAAP